MSKSKSAGKKSARQPLQLDRFVRYVLHELRTPLTILKGEIGLALKKNRPAQEYRAVLASGLEEVDRISLIVENLSLLMKYESGGALLSKISVPVTGLIKKISSDMKMPAVRKDIKMSFLPDEELSLHGDESHLSVLFRNLLGSAVKCTPAGGSIVLRLKKENGHAVARISGPDFTLPVEQPEASSVDDFALGLRVAMLIVEAHGGMLRMEKEPDGAPVLVVSIPLSIPE